MLRVSDVTSSVEEVAVIRVYFKDYTAGLYNRLPYIKKKTRVDTLMFLRSPKHFKAGKQFLARKRKYYYIDLRFRGAFRTIFFFDFSPEAQFKAIFKALNISTPAQCWVSHISIRSAIRIKFF